MQISQLKQFEHEKSLSLYVNGHSEEIVFVIRYLSLEMNEFRNERNSFIRIHRIGLSVIYPKVIKSNRSVMTVFILHERFS